MKPGHRKQQEVDVRSLGCFAVFLLLLNRHSAWLAPAVVARGRFVLGARLSDVPELVLRALHIPWLGPGLVLALLLLATLRGARRMAYKPLHRKFRMPRLERHRGEIPRRHRDLEI
jgi:hypothetical protein